MCQNSQWNWIFEFWTYHFETKFLLCLQKERKFIFTVCEKIVWICLRFILCVLHNLPFCHFAIYCRLVYNRFLILSTFWPWAIYFRCETLLSLSFKCFLLVLSQTVPNQKLQICIQDILFSRQVIHQIVWEYPFLDQTKVIWGVIFVLSFLTTKSFLL